MIDYIIFFECLFWLTVVLILHTYIIYPLILFVLSKDKMNPICIKKEFYQPNVSLVVSVFNEEKALLNKKNNLKNLDYPKSHIEFIFGSDGSADKSVEILKIMSQEGMLFFEFKERRGKAAVINDLISKATGDIIVFTDANTEFEPSTIRELVKHFDDPTVGAVSGHLILRSNKERSNAGEYSYWAFENKLKLMESRISSLLGATGGVYAIRKSLFDPLPTDISVTDDFLIPMKILKKGFRTVYEPEAKAFEELESSIGGEFRRKVRIGAQNVNILPFIIPLLHPRYGFISFSLWSHKILRWLVPFFLLVIILLLYILSDISQFYRIFYNIMLVFGGFGLFGLIADMLKISIRYFGYPYYFLAMNFALCVGTFKAVFGLQRPTWNVVR
jgi:poly-beta-1,6-N-acetyl-D-glucosamine synthase